MPKRSFLLSLICLIAVIGVFAYARPSSAGFGIQPPYVKPAKAIFPGTHYEQRINILRSSAEVDMKAIIKVTAPEIAPWISIDKGEEFDLPKDQLRVPMIVRIDVPKDAPIGNYKGFLSVKMEQKEKDVINGVAIALGARVEIDLNVTNETFLDFIIRKVEIPALEQLKAPWNWKLFSWFFYRIKVNMLIENTGNTKISPSRVHVEIFDNAKEKKLEAHDDNSIKKIDPFQTKEVVATFPTDLGPGEYWAKLSIYKDKEIMQKNEIIFTVYAPGKAPIPTQLGKWPYIMMAGLILFFLLFLLLLVKLRIWRHLGSLLALIFWPFFFIYGKLRKAIQQMKIRFWRWMHAKASRYQDDDKRGRR